MKFKVYKKDFKKIVDYLINERNGEKYDANAVRETVALLYKIDDGLGNIGRFDTNSLSFSYSSREQRTAKTIFRANDADSSVETNRGRISHGNQQNIQRTKAELEDSAFSISEKTDADYLKAVENGDMETAQRMVDEVDVEYKK